MVSRLVGRVHFTASLDGDRVPKDARRYGEEAGREGARGYDKTWSKGFEDTLNKNYRRNIDLWRQNGKNSGDAFGRELSGRFLAFMRDAQKNYGAMRLEPGFLDDFNRKFGDAGLAAGALQRQLVELNREGFITEKQFNDARVQLDEWVDAQRRSGDETNRQRDAIAKLNDDLRTQATTVREVNEQTDRIRRNSIAQLKDDLLTQRTLMAEVSAQEKQRAFDAANHARARENLIRVEREHIESLRSVGREWSFQNRLAREVDERINRVIDSNSRLNLSWRDMSHNARQWTLIITAITAALPELAGLGSAVGSGLVALAAGATAGAVGLTGLISSIVVLNGDIEKLPPELLNARRGLDDFKGSFSDLGRAMATRAFRSSEEDFRSLGATVRGLEPAFGPVSDSVARLTNELAVGIAPGTRNYENLLTVISNSAPQFETLTRAAGRLGEGLLDGFANPAMVRSVTNLTGYIYDLSDGFATFLEGDKMDDWLRHGEAVFGAFGRLLGTTGRLLDDLVTPGSINRLTTFMDNIGIFLDTGGRGILTFADQLNVFGLISEVLADVGVALEPLREPMVDLAEAISGALTPAIDGGAAALGALATAAAPVVQTLADLIAVAPPELWTALGFSLTAVGAGLIAIRSARGIQTIVADLRGLNAEGGKTPSILGKIGRAAGLIGLGVTGVTLLAGGLQTLYENTRKFDDVSRNAIATNQSLSSVWDALGTSAFGTTSSMENMSAALDQVANVGPRIDQVFPTLAATFTESGRQASQLSQVLSELSPNLATLANQDVQAASSQFASWATQLGATDAQVLNMLNAMPEFKEALVAVSQQTGGTASDTDLLNLALGRSAGSTRDNVGALGEMQAQAALTGDQVDSLANKIRGFGNENLSARDANRAFYDAIQSLTGAVGENGTSLDITTESGRRNEAALDALAQAALNSAAATLEQTGNQDDATAAIQRGRDELIKQLGQFGITGQAAEDYANELGLIPGDVATEVRLLGADAAEARLQQVARNRVAYIQSIVTEGGARPTQGGQTFASGGILTKPDYRLAGEDGPEAYIPLSRPLHQVDPSVRWLSAIAQGKMAPAQPAQQQGRSGPLAHVDKIVIEDARDARRVALETMDAIAETVMG